MNQAPIVNQTTVSAIQKNLATYFLSLKAQFSKEEYCRGQVNERTYYQYYVDLHPYFIAGMTRVSPEERALITQVAFDKVHETMPELTDINDIHFKFAFQNAVLMQPDSMEWLNRHPIMAPVTNKKLKTETEIDRFKKNAKAPHKEKAELPADLTQLLIDSFPKPVLNLFAQTSQHTRELARGKIQTAITNGQVVYALARHCEVFLESQSSASPNVSFGNLLQDYYQFQQRDLGESIVVFPTQEDAYYFGQYFDNPTPIVTLVNFGTPVTFHTDTKNHNQLGFPVQMTYRSSRIPADQTYTMGIEYVDTLPMLNGKPLVSNSLHFSTVFVPVNTPVKRSENTEWKKSFTRKSAHHEFMKTFPNGPLTVHHLHEWLQVFYCDFYLAKQKNGLSKRIELQDMLLQVRIAVRKGALQPTTFEEFLNLRPTGEKSFREVIAMHRQGKSTKPTWGMETIESTFLKPKPQPNKVPTFFNRRSMHKDFMASMPRNPKALDLIRWIKEFYCNQYLPHQKNGERKTQNILTLLGQVDMASMTPDLSAKNFLAKHPLLSQAIQDARAGSGKTWGWGKVEESFVSVSPS